MPTTKSALISVVTVLRTYGHRLLAKLTEEEIHWVPAQTQGRSIYNYFLHLVNAEIYWLKELGYSPQDYVEKDTLLDKILQEYDVLEIYLIQSIEKLPQDQLELITPKNTSEGLTRAGTFGWMIWRTSFHAIHHLAQIASIRVAQGNATLEDPETSWSKVMDQIIMLKCGSE